MKLLNNEGIELKELDLGIVEVGQSKEYEYTLLNNNGTQVNRIGVDVDRNNELTVLECPEYLNEGEKGKVRIKWEPNLKIKSGLHVPVRIHGIEIWK